MLNQLNFQILEISFPSDLTMTLASLSPEDKLNVHIQFALEVQTGWLLGNYQRLFKLYRRAPSSAQHVMDLFLERERRRALASILKAYVYWLGWG